MSIELHLFPFLLKSLSLYISLGRHGCKLSAWHICTWSYIVTRICSHGTSVAGYCIFTRCRRFISNKAFLPLQNSRYDYSLIFLVVAVNVFKITMHKVMNTYFIQSINWWKTTKLMVLTELFILVFINQGKLPDVFSGFRSNHRIMRVIKFSECPDAETNFSAATTRVTKHFPGKKYSLTLR